MKKKFFVSTVLVSAISFMSVSPVFAATAVDSDVIKENISADNENWTQGMIEEQWTATHSSPLFSAFYLSSGKHVRHPAEGGKWTYGFWNAKVHSEYKVNKKHGSTVVYIDIKRKKHKQRSIDTATGKTSIAEVWAINLPKTVDRYYYRVVK